MTKCLYIVGNGFDRYHGIPSDYRDFAQYLRLVDREIYRLVEEYFSLDDDFWWEFETRLADFDTDAVEDYASNFLMSYGADDWSDSGHHDYEYEIDRIARGVSKTMRQHFAAWVRSLPIPTNPRFATLDIDRSAKFFTFNYTPTLERLYGVPADRILHIHGSALDSTASLVLGHGWESNPNSQVGKVDADTDVRVAGGYERIDQYFRDTFKPTEIIIAANRLFFEALTHVTEIRILGHSLADVDEPYFSAVIDAVKGRDVRWRISFQSNPTSIKERFIGYRVPPHLVSYEPMDNFRASARQGDLF